MTTFEFDSSLKRTLSRLDELPSLIERKLVRGALREAAKPLRDAAKAQAPVGASRTVYDQAGNAVPYAGGDLKKSIRISSTFSKKTGEVKILVKAGNKRAWYANLVEHGAKAHTIKGPVHFAGNYYTNIAHPGFSGKPYMRPAFDSCMPAVMAAYAEYMTKHLPQALAQYGRN